MKKVYFVRHGESQSNVGGVILNAETPLTDKGYEQAAAIAERCSRLPIEIIISSTMLRARETGRVISEVTQKDIVHSDLFVERRNPSVYKGRLITDPEIQDIETKIQDAFITDPSYRHSDEENFADLKQRAIAALEFLASRPEEHIAVTTHGTFLHILFGVAVLGEGLDAPTCNSILKGMRASNTGVTLLEYREDNTKTPWCVITWNDHAHLG